MKYLIGLFVVFCLFKFTVQQTTYTFIGTNCVEHSPTGCDFDDADNWSVDPAGQPASPAQKTDAAYAVVFSATEIAKNYTVVTGSATYYFSYIALGSFGAKKSTGDDVKRGLATSGLSLIIKDTTLYNFQSYDIDDGTALIFENVIINQGAGNGQCYQHENSLVKFTGTTHATFDATWGLAANDKFIVDSEATLINLSSMDSFINTYNGDPIAHVEIHGNLYVPNGWRISNGNTLVDLTGCNCTSGDTFDFRMQQLTIGKSGDSNAANVPTKVRTLQISADSTFTGHSIVDTDLIFTTGAVIKFEQNAKVNVKDLGYTGYNNVINPLHATLLTQYSTLLVQGGAQVSWDKNVVARDIFAKRGASNAKTVQVTGGILEFKQDFYVIHTTYIVVNNLSSYLKFKNFNDTNRIATLTLTAGTISFDNYFGPALELEGVTLAFGGGIIDAPQDIVVVTGALQMAGTTVVNNISVTARSSDFSGYGRITGDLVLSEEPPKGGALPTPSRLLLSNPGNQLVVDNAIGLTDTEVVFTINGANVGSVKAKTINLSTTTFSIDVQSAPTQDTTYIVAEYTNTFTVDTMPTSVDPTLYTIEHDQTNKQIKIHYIYTAPPTGPVSPTPPTNGPTATPTNAPTGAPNAASAITTTSTLLFSLFAVLLLVLA